MNSKKKKEDAILENVNYVPDWMPDQVIQKKKKPWEV